MQPMTASVMFSAPSYPRATAASFADMILDGLSQLLEEGTGRAAAAGAGNGFTIGVKARNPMVCSISWATITSCALAARFRGQRDGMVSPMPSCSSTPIAAVEATIPFDPMPASGQPEMQA